MIATVTPLHPDFLAVARRAVDPTAPERARRYRANKRGACRV
jgi:hypothetical protein